MIARLIEEIRTLDAGPPVDGADEEIEAWLQLADHLLEIVAAVSVQNQQLSHALTRQRCGDVGKNCQLGAGIHVDGEAKIRLAPIHSKGYRRQRHHLRSVLP